ncbi:MAG: 3-deoxy-D-manno-octulosonic acid transferase [Gammaproteobacteria bacterium]
MTTWVTRLLYGFLLVLLLPAIFLVTHWRALRQTRRPDNWLERFAFIEPMPSGRVIWVHAASLGEVQAAIPLVKSLQKLYPDCHLLLTAFTSAGVQRFQTVFQDHVRVTRFPYDLSSILIRFLNQTRPSCCVIVETEIWPNLFELLGKRNVPLVYASARLSDSSVRAYSKLGNFLRATMQNVSYVTAQTDEDATKFASLGVPGERIVVTGNLKFDLEIPASSIERGRAIRAEWFANRRVFLAASTRVGEDELVLSACRELCDARADASVIIVPRHPERAASIEQLARKQNFSVTLYSRVTTRPEGLLIVDTLGELLDFYSAADLVFVGGSLVPLGGHNLVEPAALGLPILTGRYHFNAPTIADELLRQGGLIMVNSERELAQEAIRLLDDNEKRAQLGEAARVVVEKNRGSLESALQQVRQVLPHYKRQGN